MQLKEIIPFEDEPVDLMNNIKFHKVSDDLQIKLRQDVRKVSSSKKSLKKEKYHLLLQTSLTTTYKASNKEIATRVNCEGIKYAKEANILHRVEVNGTANCFITLKDHKANFLNHHTTRLTYPVKNEIGRISK